MLYLLGVYLFMVVILLCSMARNDMPLGWSLGVCLAWPLVMLAFLFGVGDD